ncbi:hypothetical protein H4219_003230, partial [Mycoemilia scoparia]
QEVREKTRSAFYHAYNSYINYAYPLDELNPFTCDGRGRETGPGSENNPINDILGNFSLTLIDNLDTLAVLGDRDAFSDGMFKVIDHLPSFDLDSTVQLFEVNIRILGGLLSAHIIATDDKDRLKMQPVISTQGRKYDGELLELARDLGLRFLSAFESSPNAIPYSKLNLKNGVTKNASPTTCTAGVATLLLEFATLSRLVNETIFEDVARMALEELWSQRSGLDLLGNEFNVHTKNWETDFSGIGAGIDSFYEYLFKSGIYLDDDKLLSLFHSAYDSLVTHSLDRYGGYFFYNVNMYSGNAMNTWIDSLSAFFPGLMVLAGHIDAAEKIHMVYYHLWRRYRVMPERFNLFHRRPDFSNYPLRPEFIESNYHLYRATRDPFYLEIGEMVLEDLLSILKTRCGFASVKNAETLELEDRMESFFLSETLKYLYLLFDEDNIINRLDGNFVFTTEGHIFLPLPPSPNSNSSLYTRSTSRVRRLYNPDMLPPYFDEVHKDRKNIESRIQVQNVLKKVGGHRERRAFGSNDNGPPKELCEIGYPLVTRQDLTISNQKVDSANLSFRITPTLPLRPDFDLAGALVGAERKDNSIELVKQAMCKTGQSGIQRVPDIRPSHYHSILENIYEIGLEGDAFCISPSAIAPKKQGDLEASLYMPYLSRASTSNTKATHLSDIWLRPEAFYTTFFEIITASLSSQSFPVRKPEHLLGITSRQTGFTTIPSLTYRESSIMVNKLPNDVPVTNGGLHVVSDIVQVRAYMDVTCSTISNWNYHHQQQQSLGSKSSKPNTDKILPKISEQACSNNKEKHPSALGKLLGLQPFEPKNPNLIITHTCEYLGRMALFSETVLLNSMGKKILPTDSKVVFLHHIVPKDKDAHGCNQHPKPLASALHGKIVVIKRGGNCTFWDKSRYAADAGSLGVIIAIDSEKDMRDGDGPWLSKIVQPGVLQQNDDVTDKKNNFQNEKDNISDTQNENMEAILSTNTTASNSTQAYEESFQNTNEPIPTQQEPPSPSILSIPVVAMFIEAVDELEQFKLMGISINIQMF